MASVRPYRGKWRALIRRKGHPEIAIVRDTEAEATREARAVEAKMDKQQYLPAPKDTLAEWAQRYMEERKASARGLTASVAEGMRRIEVSELGKVKAGRITSAELVTHFTGPTQYGKPPVPATVVSRRYWLGRLFRHAKDAWGVQPPLTALAAADAVLKADGATALPTERDRRVPDAELDKLCAAAIYRRRRMAGTHCGKGVAINWHDLFRFAVLSTMRRSEICRLRWKFLDEEGSRIFVEDRKDPKRKKGNHQWVPLLPEALAILKAQPRVSDRIFPCRGSAVTQRFEAAAKRAKIEDVRFHDLRHEGISRLFDMGYDIPTVALFSGHKTWSQLRRYTHLKAEDVGRRAAGKKPVQVDTQTDEFQLAVMAAAMRLLQAQNEGKVAQPKAA